MTVPKILILILFTITITRPAYAQTNHYPLPPGEIKIINQVADEYGLEGDSRTLLFVIRIVENGENPRQFGVLNPQAMRYTDNPQKSFITQCRWAAGTIAKRFTGDLKKFGQRWCPPGAHPLNENWLPNALYWMEKLEVIRNEIRGDKK